MSYTESVSAELSQLSLKKRCCRNAFLSALFLRGTLKDGYLSFFVLQEDAVPLVQSAFDGLFHQKINPVPVRHGATIRFVFRTDNADAVALFEKRSTDLCVCEGCFSAYLRGLFFASGSVNDPTTGSFHLSFTVPETDVSAEAILSANGLTPKTISRPQGKNLYYKDSTVIADVLAVAGLHKLIFDFYNVKIEREIRNNENRATNCVAKNIEKSMAASRRQIELLTVLKNSPLFASLTDDCRTTVELRLDNPDCTLEELASMHQPALTKSGLYHRLEKLCRMAEGGKK